MPKKKIEENHVITEPDFSEASDFTESEDSPYEPDMAPLAKEKTEVSDNTEKTGVFVKLTGGSSFTTGDYFFRKDEPAPVPEELAEKLLKTGFFERV
ncbi:MAG: hypothetical protein ACI4I9_04670 [Porcipelethomonas sp.]